MRISRYYKIIDKKAIQVKLLKEDFSISELVRNKIIYKETVIERYEQRWNSPLGYSGLTIFILMIPGIDLLNLEYLGDNGEVLRKFEKLINLEEVKQEDIYDQILKLNMGNSKIKFGI